MPTLPLPRSSSLTFQGDPRETHNRLEGTGEWFWEAGGRGPRAWEEGGEPSRGHPGAEDRSFPCCLPCRTWTLSYLRSRMFSAVASLHYDTVGNLDVCGPGHGVPWVTDALNPLSAGTRAEAFLRSTLRSAGLRARPQGDLARTLQVAPH